MPADKKDQNTSGQGSTGTGAGMQVSGEQIFREEGNQPKVTQDSDVFGKQSQTSGSGQGGQQTGQQNAQRSGQQQGSQQNAQQSGSQPSETAQQIASQVGEVLRGNTSGVTETAKDALNQAKGVAGQVASQAFGQVQQKAGSAIEERKQDLTQGLTSVADSIRSLGENLRTSEEQSTIATVAAKYSDTAADQVEQLARYFETRDLRDLSRDVQVFARRNPTVFVAGAFITGLLAARFLKSSPRQELMLRDQNYDTDFSGRNTGSRTRSNRRSNARGANTADIGATPSAGAGAPGIGATEATGTTGTTGTTGSSGGTTTTNPAEVG